MKRLTLTCATILISIAATPTLSQDKTPGRELAERVFASIEANPNGMLDMGEFINFGRSIFTSMDGDDDETVTFEEFTGFDFGFDAIAKESGEERAYETAQKIVFAFWDRDGDGNISSSEYRTSMASDFERADVDNDALLTQDEFLRGYIINRAYRAALTGR